MNYKQTLKIIKPFAPQIFEIVKGIAKDVSMDKNRIDNLKVVAPFVPQVIKVAKDINKDISEEKERLAKIRSEHYQESFKKMVDEVTKYAK